MNAERPLHNNQSRLRAHSSFGISWEYEIDFSWCISARPLTFWQESELVLHLLCCRRRRQDLCFARIAFSFMWDSFSSLLYFIYFCFACSRPLFFRPRFFLSFTLSLSLHNSGLLSLICFLLLSDFILAAGLKQKWYPWMYQNALHMKLNTKYHQNFEFAIMLFFYWIDSGTKLRTVWLSS